MKKSTKIFLILFALTFIPAVVLGKYVFQGIQATEKGFLFNFPTLGIVGLVFWGVSMVFGMVCYIKFLRSLKLSHAIFFSIFPVTIFYGGSMYLISNLTILPINTAKALSSVLNISTENNYNSVLWVVILTLFYLFFIFLNLIYLCRPIQKVENITEKLGDGRLNEGNFVVGKSKQFKKIENSLEKINYNYKEKENLVKQTDLEAQKFIPKEFLRFLGKNTIRDLELGNKVTKRGTTLFCDLSSGEKKSKELTLEESFNFINSYLNLISPIVRKYDGFIDKYLGDGLLAVFPRPERAIECSNAIFRAITLKNKDGKSGLLDVKIAVNTGDIVFGVVGEEERKSPTIISDVVEIVSRMQEVNSKLGSRVVFSKQTLNETPDKFNFDYRYLGSLNYDNHAIMLYENLDAYERDKKEKLFRLKNRFEDGVRDIGEGNYREAKKNFEEVLKYVSDKPSYVYFNKCIDKLTNI